MSKKLFAMLLVLAMVLSIGGAAFADENTPLVVAYSPFSAKFSPFYADTGYDQDAVEMTQISILTTDRSGGIIYNAIEDIEAGRGEPLKWNIRDVIRYREKGGISTTKLGKVYGVSPQTVINRINQYKMK